ncbi:hypothetical protein HMI56_002221 [Coelomomyces lativittatus]|nr:hypothetical protein HMI56_002221 [Coelomomyces lativittatus]
MHSLEEQEEEKEEDEEKVKEKVNRIERMTIETHAEVMEGVDDQTSSTFLVKDFVASSSSSSLDDFLHSDSESSIDEETESWMATELMLLKTHEEQEEQEQEENLKENPVGEVVLEPEVIHPNSLKSPPLSTSTNLTSSLSWSDPVHAFHPLTHDEEEETQKQILNQLRKDLIEQTQRYFEQCFFLEQAQRSMNTLERSILKKRSHLHELKRHAHGIQVNSKRETRVAYEKEHSRTKALLHQSRVFSQRWTWELTQWTSWISQNNGIETGITHSPFGGLPALHIFLQEKQKELMDLKQHSNTLTLDYKELEVLYVFERDRQTCIDGQVNAKRSLPTTQETPSHLPSEDDPSFRLESSSSSSSSANKRNRGPFMPSSPPVVDVKTYFYSARPTSSVEKRGIAFKWVLDPSSHHILALDLSSPPPPSSSHEDASTLSSTSEVAVLDEVPYLIQASHLLVADLHGNQVTCIP